jgi:hypothetical protein
MVINRGALTADLRYVCEIIALIPHFRARLADSGQFAIVTYHPIIGKITIEVPPGLV